MNDAAETQRSQRTHREARNEASVALCVLCGSVAFVFASPGNVGDSTP